MEYLIASDVNRDILAVEIYYPSRDEGEMWVEVYQPPESQEFVVNFYEISTQLPVADVIIALQKAMALLAPYTSN